MRTFGIIGYPLTHSFSQKYFSEKFKHEGHDARYLNFAISSIDELPELLEHHPYIAGLNVTIPYKQLIFNHLNNIDEVAREVGAVNVVKLTWDGKVPTLNGFNTDIVGFTNSLLPLLQQQHTKALILGTGGAAKAVAYSLKKLGISFRFVSRSPQNPAEVSYHMLSEEIVSSYKLIVNTTPLGMYPNVEEYPSIPYDAIGTEHLCYDLTYNPPVTSFLQRAADRGAVIKNGLEMLHIQAEDAWKIWNL
jgi:shikimate dehydrogenase